MHWVFSGIPESVALATLVMFLNKKDCSWRVIVQIGIIQSACAYFIRLLPITPGVHVILLITTLAGLAVVIGKLDLKLAAISSFIVFILLGIFEFFFFYLIINVLRLVNIEDVKSGNIAMIMMSYPQVLSIFILAFIIRIKGINLRWIFKNDNDVNY